MNVEDLLTISEKCPGRCRSTLQLFDYLPNSLRSLRRLNCKLLRVSRLDPFILNARILRACLASDQRE